MDFNKIFERMRGLDDRAFEDQLYQLVWNEIELGRMDPVAQARSIEDGLGDDGLTKSAYIKHRVRRLRDELEKRRKADLDTKREAEEVQRSKEKAEEQRNAERKTESRNAERKTIRAGFCALCDEKVGVLNFTGSGFCWPCLLKVTRR